jgi:hypothetical protein
MQNIIDVEEKIFFECKNILESLSKITTQDELLLKQDLFYELTERIAFLKLLDKNKEGFYEDNGLQDSQSPIQLELQNNEMLMENERDALDTENYELEEVIFNNELNEIHAEHNEEALEKPHLDNHFSDLSNNEKLLTKNLVEEKDSEEFVEDDSPVAELMKDDEKTEDEPEIVPQKPNFENDNRGKIIANEKDNAPSNEQEVKVSTAELQASEDKKISLGHIKGIKIIESLFDDDPLERITESEQYIERKATTSEANVALEMEKTPKKQLEFRLDMNDKIAFSKNLFGGSQLEMNETIAILNSFTQLNEAKEYLSDLYYAKQWNKVDDYAQRLWTLVENKFL